MSSVDRSRLKTVADGVGVAMRAAPLPVRIALGVYIGHLFVLIESLIDRIEKLEGKK